MTSAPLGKLVDLARQVADKSRDSLEREAQQLRLLDHQRKELQSINQEYQHSLVGKSDVAPQLLAHRRAFVEQLTQRLDELGSQRETKRKTLQIREQEVRHRTAQHKAIEMVNERRVCQQTNVKHRRDQQRLDELANGQHVLKNAMDKDLDND